MGIDNQFENEEDNDDIGGGMAESDDAHEELDAAGMDAKKNECSAMVQCLPNNWGSRKINCCL